MRSGGLAPGTRRAGIGLVSRAGIIPIAHSQDTAGPMARTVADATILLGTLTGIDARDAATSDLAVVHKLVAPSK